MNDKKENFKLVNFKLDINISKTISLRGVYLRGNIYFTCASVAASFNYTPEKLYEKINSERHFQMLSGELIEGLRKLLHDGFLFHLYDDNKWLSLKATRYSIIESSLVKKHYHIKWFDQKVYDFFETLDGVNPFENPYENPDSDHITRSYPKPCAPPPPSPEPVPTIEKPNERLTDDDRPYTEEYINVNHPKHYVNHPSGIECIEITKHMDFLIGNAVKYLWRYESKNKPIEDLEKAIFYINKRIEVLKDN
jgi:hypothetical protein